MPYTFDSNNGSNTEYYANLIEKEENRVAINIETESDSEVETVQDSEILDSNKFKGLSPDQVDAIKRDEQVKKEKVKVINQLSKTFNNIYKDLNQKFGLDINIDLDSFYKSIEFITDSKNKRALELYGSEAFDRTKIILFQMYTNAIGLLSTQLCSPEYLLSESMEYTQKAIILEKLIDTMKKLNELSKEIKIPDAEMKLAKLNEDLKPKINMNNHKVREFLDSFSEASRLENKS